MLRVRGIFVNRLFVGTLDPIDFDHAACGLHADFETTHGLAVCVFHTRSGVCGLRTFAHPHFWPDRCDLSPARVTLKCSAFSRETSDAMDRMAAICRRFFHLSQTAALIHAFPLNFSQARKNRADSGS